MAYDYDAEQTNLTPEDLEKMEDKTFTMVRPTEPRIVTNQKGGAPFKFADLVVESKDKRVLAFSVFATEYEPVVKLIQSQKLRGSHGIREFGIRLTLGTEAYTKKGAAEKSKKIIILQADAPAQAAL